LLLYHPSPRERADKRRALPRSSDGSLAAQGAMMDPLSKWMYIVPDGRYHM